MMPAIFPRHKAWGFLLVISVVVLLIPKGYAQTSAQTPAPEQLRVGYQKAAVNLVITKENRLFEQRFPNTRIIWTEFPAGPQMLEALNVGSIDLGATGDTPPIFAQAAGADLLYIGAEPAKPKSEGILVPENSPLQNVAELKEKNVAFQRGSSSHNLVLRALRRAELVFSEIKPVYLTPADARAAFERGSIDAWAVWDPYFSAALLAGGARVLVDGTGLSETGTFYLASRPYAQNNGAFLSQVLEVLTEADSLTQSDRQRSIELLATAMGLPENVVARYLDNRTAGGTVSLNIVPLDKETVAAQQRTADVFFDNKLIPVAVDVSQRIWQPQQP